MSEAITFPVSIDGFTFHAQAFSFKGREYRYADVLSLKFQVQRTTINFSTLEIYHFSMRVPGDAVVSLSISDATFSFQKKKVAERKKTCSQLQTTSIDPPSSDA